MRHLAVVQLAICFFHPLLCLGLLALGQRLWAAVLIVAPRRSLPLCIGFRLSTLDALFLNLAALPPCCFPQRRSTSVAVRWQLLAELDGLEERVLVRVPGSSIARERRLVARRAGRSRGFELLRREALRHRAFVRSQETILPF